MKQKYTFLLFIVLLSMLCVTPAHASLDHWVTVEGKYCYDQDLQLGSMSWSVQSWAQDDSGKNPDVTVYKQVQHKNVVSQYMLIAASGFTDTYSITDTLLITYDISRITIRVEVNGTWGDGHDGGQVASVDFFPEICAAPTADQDTNGEPDKTTKLYQVWIPLMSHGASTSNVLSCYFVSTPDRSVIKVRVLNWAAPSNGSKIKIWQNGDWLTVDTITIDHDGYYDMPHGNRDYALITYNSDTNGNVVATVACKTF